VSILVSVGSPEAEASATPKRVASIAPATTRFGRLLPRPNSTTTQSTIPSAPNPQVEVQKYQN